VTLSSTTTKVQYDGDGSTVSFSVSFNFWADGDVRAILRDASETETTWVKGTQYTLTGGSATGSTGTLTVKTSPTDYTPQVGETLTIMSVHAVTQETSFPLGGAFPSTSAETQNDKLARLIQQTQEIIKRAVKFKETTTSANENLELGEPVALAIPRWNSAKTKLESTLVEDLNIGLGTAFRYGFDSSTLFKLFLGHASVTFWHTCTPFSFLKQTYLFFSGEWAPSGLLLRDTLSDLLWLFSDLLWLWDYGSSRILNLLSAIKMCYIGPMFRFSAR